MQHAQKHAVKGYIERMGLSSIWGWAFDANAEAEKPERIRAYCRGELIGETTARLWRPDLADLTDGNHHCGFHMEVRTPYDVDDVVVRVGGSTLPIAEGESTADYAALTASLYHNFVDWPVNERPLVETVPSKTPNDIDVCKRLIEVYRRVLSHEDKVFAGTSSMWTGLVDSNFAHLSTIVRNGDPAELCQYLLWMHKRAETWGLSQGPESYFVLKHAAAGSGVVKMHAAMYFSELLSLAEYLTLVPIENASQGLRNTTIEPAELMRAIERTIGINPAFPHKIGGLFCVDTGAGLLQQRDVWALYAALRIKHLLRDTPGARVCEIGCGLGQLSHYSLALGLGHYTMIDLPHVSLLQAFQLMRIHPDKTFALWEGGDFDTDAQVRIYPTFMFERAPNGFFDLCVNVDSMPEMGASNATAYVKTARGKAKRFLSINQEAKTPWNVSGERQIKVPEIFASVGLAEPQYRFRSWVRRGYVEAVWDLSVKATPAAVAIEGYLDLADHLWVAGWARSFASETPRTIEIRANGKPLAHTTAEQHWPALHEQGIGTGRYGFAIRTPIDVFDGERHELRAYDVETGVELGNSPKIVSFPSILPYASAIAETLKTDPWVIDNFSFAGDAVTIAGWALAPRGDAAAAEFRINGEKFDTVQWPLHRNDIHQSYFYHPGAARAGFVLTKDISKIRRGASELVLQFAASATGESLTSYQDYFYPLAQNPFPLPDPARRKRVMGSVDEHIFVLGGYTLARKLEALLPEKFGRKLDELPSILDWGCGCGRLLRFLASSRPMRDHLAGADIDGDNVGWCSENLPGVTFRKLALSPPAKFPDDKFDLIIGNSVFTHLGEQQQNQWLDELHRIAAPGGLIMVSVQAASELPRATFHAPAFERLLKTGFLSDSLDDALDGVVANADYRATFHSHDYIKSVWGEKLKVVEILPQFANNLQDLVILQKH